METILSIKPLMAVLVSIMAVPLILVSKRPNVRETWTFMAAIAKFLIVISMVPVVLSGKHIVFNIANVFSGVSIGFRVDPMGILFAIVSSFLWIITSAYSIGYMRGLNEHSQKRYFSFFALSLSATMGVAFASNLLTLYLFYEMLSFSTYPLVTHHQDVDARRSGRKYLLYIVGLSIGFVLPSMLVIYNLTGTLDFATHGFLNGNIPTAMAAILLVAMLFGFAKAAIMPFHSWLPAAMVAPTPVSALLHAVAVVKVGAFCVVRVLVNVFGVELLSSTHLNITVCVIASFTIITASCIALSQDGLKRRLAFSTISQLSYIVLGAALLSPRGFVGGILHIVMHAFGKITLFFCAGAIFVATGIKNISEMDGIGKKMPLTMSAFFIGSLSVIGLPPCGGFISKWYLLLGALDTGQLAMLIVILVSSLLNAAYFLPIVYSAFFKPLKKDTIHGRIDEAPMWCLIPLCITAIGSIILFLYPEPFFSLAQMAANSIFTK